MSLQKTRHHFISDMNLLDLSHKNIMRKPLLVGPQWTKGSGSTLIHPLTLTHTLTADDPRHLLRQLYNDEMCTLFHLQIRSVCVSFLTIDSLHV